MLRKIKKIYGVISVVIVVAVFVLAVLLVGVRITGLKTFAVLSGSMEPKYHVGSIIYVDDVDPTTLKVGDPLTFTLGGTVITHEIIEVNDAEDPRDMTFVTKGLTNNIPDGQIGVSDIVGKPVFTIPYLGYVSVYLQNPIGVVGVVCLVLVVVMLSLMLEFIPDGKKTVKASKEQSIISDSPADPVGETDENINNQEKINQEEKQ